MPILFANNAVTTLAAPIEPWHTSLRVAPGDGDRFPAPDSGAGEYFLLTLSAPDGALEVVEVSSRAGDVLQVARGREGTAPLSFAADDRVELRLTAGAMEGLLQSEAIAPERASTVKNVWYVAADDAIENHADPERHGSLAWVLAAVGAGRAEVVLPGGHTYRLEADLTVPEAVRLVPHHGALLSLAGGVTLTLDGAMAAGQGRVFTGQGTAAGTAGGARVLPQWWGARGDGATDDTLALSQALAFPRVHLPAGTYLTSAPLPLAPHTVVTGEAPPAGYIDWEEDHEKAEPSFAGRASVIQYKDGAHGALFTAAGEVAFSGLAFRAGQARTAADMFFSGPASHLRLTDCRFENLEAVVADPTGATDFGALAVSGCLFCGCGDCFSGALTDAIIRGNTFTSCATAIRLVTGAGLNTIAANRFEWNTVAIEAYQARPSTITGNVFDAQDETALKFVQASRHVVSANLFWRNGRDGSAPEKRSHVVLKEQSRVNVFTGNVFLKGSADGSAEPVWPRHVVELVSAGSTRNVWQGNDLGDGCTDMPVADAWGNSADALEMDDIHIRAIGNPNQSSDTLSEMVKWIASTVAAPVTVHLYEDRKWVGYTPFAPGRIRLRGHGPVTLTDAAGQAHSLLDVAELTYGQSFGPPVCQSTAPAAPTLGYWQRGAVVWNAAPASGAPIGWACTEAGTPGTWKGFGTVAS